MAQGVDHGTDYVEYLRLRSTVQVCFPLVYILKHLTKADASYVLRLLGTFVGAVFGLLCWYIGEIMIPHHLRQPLTLGPGNAKSNGSPYGAAASMGVFLVPVVFLRLFTPIHYVPGVLLAGVR